MSNTTSELLLVSVSGINNAVVDLKLIEPVKFYNVSCNFTDELFGHWVNIPDAGLSRFKYACKDGYHRALQVAAACATAVKQDGDLLLRKWDSECITNPKNKTENCLLRRYSLLAQISNSTTSGDFLSGPTDCNACTRLSMENLINNLNYLKGNPIYADNLSGFSLSSVTSGQENIKRHCGKSYDQVGLDSEAISDLKSEGLAIPIWSIVLMAIAGGVLILGLFFYVIRLRRDKSSQQLPHPKIDTLRDSYEKNCTKVDDEDMRVTTMQ